MREAAAWVEKNKIYELCARYTLTLDSHDIEAWANTFTEDGVFGFGSRGIRGRAKIAAYGQVHKSLGSRHLNLSLLFSIDPSGQRATGVSSVAMTLATKQGYKVAFIGRYADDVRKIDGQWLFSRRWVTSEPIPADPAFDVSRADPELRALLQPLFDAYESLGDEVPGHVSSFNPHSKEQHP